MLTPGKEVCGPTAELYLRVAPTCPLFYTTWTDNADDANIEFTSKVPQRGSRADVLVPFSIAELGKPFVTPVLGRVFKPRAKNDPSSPFRVLPGVVVVRSRGFAVRDSDSDSDPAPTPPQSRKRKRAFSPRDGKEKGRMVLRRGNGGDDPSLENEEEEEEHDEDGEDGEQDEASSDFEDSGDEEENGDYDEAGEDDVEDA